MEGWGANGYRGALDCVELFHVERAVKWFGCAWRSPIGRLIEVSALVGLNSRHRNASICGALNRLTATAY